MNDSVQVVLDYMKDVLFEPGDNWPDHILAERSYARWAASEIVELLMDHPFDEPDILIEAHLMDMMLYMYESESEQQRFIFTVAKETTEDILKLFIKRRRT